MSSIDRDIDQDKKHHKSVLLKLTAAIALAALLALALYLIVPLLSGEPDSAASDEKQQRVADNEAAQLAKTLSDDEKRALQQRLSQTKAVLSAIGDAKRNWQPDTITSLNDRLQKAYALYGQSHFQRTEDTLDDIDKALSQFNTAYEQAYISALEEFCL